MSANPINNKFPLGFPWQTLDPFLFCVYHKDDFPKGNGDLGPDASLAGRAIGQDFTIKDGWRMYHGSKIPGFPAHPHRGFETVTIVERGMVDHTDSMGAAGRFGDGDVQWMTAGKGVQHSEMFPLLNEDEGNPLVLFQIWLNLPKASKFVEPHFKMLWHEEIPVVEVIDESGRESKIKLIAGRYNEHKALSSAPDSWAADPTNEVAIWLIHMQPNSVLNLPIADRSVKRTMFMYQGDAVDISGESLGNEEGVELDAAQQTKIVNGSESASFLLLQGKPLNEPVAQYGPFVMNTQQEIQQAMSEYQRTQFGGWPWPRHEFTHPKDQGRFAKHADGKVEERTR